MRAPISAPALLAMGGIFLECVGRGRATPDADAHAAHADHPLDALDKDAIRSVERGVGGGSRRLQNGGFDTDDGEVAVAVAAAASVALLKSGTLVVPLDDVVPVLAGDAIDYVFAVTNTGDEPLTEVTVSDPAVSPVDCLSLSLEPGEAVLCHGSYAITQDDINAGVKVNSATAAARDPDGNSVVSAAAASSVTIPQETWVYLKTVAWLTVDPGVDAGPGDIVRYHFVAINFGNVPLKDVVIADSAVSSVVCPYFNNFYDNAVPELKVGEVVVCTGDYEIRQADIDAGKKDNTATVTATATTTPVGVQITSSDGDSVLFPSGPAIELRKVGAFDFEAVGVNPGDTIHYSFLIRNVGNVPLAAIEVNDPDISSIVCPVIVTLSPGSWMLCDGSYGIAQADIDAGFKDNAAAVAARDPADGAAISDADSYRVPLALPPEGPDLGLIKFGASPVDYGDDGPPVRPFGDFISYAFVVRNTGDVPLVNVRVFDENLGGAVLCPGEAPNPATTNVIPLLDAGEVVVCAGSYLITAEDIERGRVYNQAAAIAETLDGRDISADAEASFYIPSCGDGVRDPGEECDDGNERDGDGCAANCTVEGGVVEPTSQPTQCPLVPVCCEDDCCGTDTTYSGGGSPPSPDGGMSGRCEYRAGAPGWDAGTYYPSHAVGCVPRTCCEAGCCGEGTVWSGTPPAGTGFCVGARR